MSFLRFAFQQLLNQSAKYMKENYLSLDISFENIGFTKETQSKQIDESSLLSDIGEKINFHQSKIRFA